MVDYNGTIQANVEHNTKREQRKARIQRLQRTLLYYATTYNEHASVAVIHNLMRERKTA